MDFSFHISLRVSHPSLATDEWPKALRLRAGRSWVAGEPRATPTGRQLSGVYRQSYCYFDLKDGVGADEFGRALRSATQRIARHANLARRWRRHRGTLEYYVTISGKDDMGLEIDPILLVEIGRLGIVLGIEAFATRQRRSTAEHQASKPALRARGK